MTFSKAARLTLRRSWFIALCAIAAAGGAYRVAKPPHHRFTAQTTVHEVDTTVSYDTRGEAIPTIVLPRTATDVKPESFLDPDAAAATVKKVKFPGLTTGSLLNRLSVNPTSTTDVTIAFTSKDQALATKVVDTYAAALVAIKRNEQIAALDAARKLMQKQLKALPANTSGLPPDNATVSRSQDLAQHMDGLALGAKLVSQRIAVAGVTTVATKKKGLPKVAATAGGLVAGLAVGILVVLLLARFDRRVRSADDLRLAGARVVEIDSENRPQTVRRLWAELGLSQSDVGLAAVAVTAATGREAPEVLAERLAQTFAAAGTSTVLAVPDISGMVVSDRDPSELEAETVSPGLVRVTESLSPASVSRLLEDARHSGQAVVLACPPLAEGPEALLATASADVVVVVARRSRTRWTRLEAALEGLRESVRRPVLVCFDRAAPPAARSRHEAATEPEPSLPEQAADGVDVPVHL